MRTTVDLDMHLIQEAKQRAAERGTTLSIVEEALREAAARRRHARQAGRVTLTTDARRGGLRPGVDLADNTALRDLMAGCGLATADRGFARFPGLRWWHPVEADLP